jgi:hypothetical protein
MTKRVSGDLVEKDILHRKSSRRMKSNAGTKAKPNERKGAIQFDVQLKPAASSAGDRVPGRWLLSIDAGETAFVADEIRLYVFIWNKGPSTILVSAGRREVKLVANLFRVIAVFGNLEIETLDGEPADVELEFMPL